MKDAVAFATLDMMRRPRAGGGERWPRAGGAELDGLVDRLGAERDRLNRERLGLGLFSQDRSDSLLALLEAIDRHVAKIPDLVAQGREAQAIEATRRILSSVSGTSATSDLVDDVAKTVKEASGETVDVVKALATAATVVSIALVVTKLLEVFSGGRHAR